MHPERSLDHTAVLIPAYRPSGALPDLVGALLKEGFGKVLVVDDGSGEDFTDLFAQAESRGADVLRCPVNRGKGAALKTGIKKAGDLYGSGVLLVTADADGQHLPSDIRRVALALSGAPSSLVLGVRDFSGKDVPFRSRLGNRVTAAVFALTTGVSCPDTQTGLRGIPACLRDLALETEGDRYEYEMNFLTAAASRVPLVQVPIQTVYEEDNASSHFRPVRDSLRVYGRPLRFLGSSLAGAAIDLCLFHVLEGALAGVLSPEARVLAAAVPARLVSGSANFLLNRYWCFGSRQAAGPEAVRYLALFLAQMAASAGCCAGLVHLGLPALPAKVLTDTFLFIISYQIQKRWVFGPRKDRA